MRVQKKSHLREIRLSKGLTQVELAAAAEVGLSTISWLENGTRKVSRRKKIKVAAALGTDVEQIFPSGDSRGIAPMASDR